MSRWQEFIKRCLDILASAVGLLLLTPVLLIIALVVSRDSEGPAIFRQRRAGKAGRSFECYKFRTMFQRAADIRNVDGSTFSSEDDSRVTRAGRILRRTSLDELPQLLNVLKGEMSLVGPRPDQVDQIGLYAPDEVGRLSIKPGITGLAQINGRNSISWERRKQLDLQYVARQSLWLDTTILLRTIPYVAARRSIFVTKASANTDERIPG